MKAPLAAAAACIAMALPAQAAEITVMSGGAVRSAFNGAAASWEKASGNKVNAAFAPAGDLRKKVASGERTDIIIIPVEHFAALEKEGAIDASSRRDLGAVAIAAAVKQGAAVPDISTPEKLRSTLVAAKSVTYMDPERGTSGKHFDEGVLAKLGVRDEVRAKAKLGEGGYIAEKVASGEVEIAFHQMTEIIPVQGITIVGLLPAELQKTTVYSGAVMKGARNPREAQALLDYLASPDGRKYFLDRGFTSP
jgi:molybdate transport system substrate-binding protein